MTRYAVLIGVATYEDDRFADLRSPRADVDAIGAALRDNCHFDECARLVDPTYKEAVEAIEGALAKALPRDLVFVSFSGHGTKNRRGRLHLAFRDTRHDRLAGGALSADTLHHLLDEARVESKVLLLDCCNSGAFADRFATRGGEDEDIDFRRELEDEGSEGTFVLAASGATQPAHEGDNSTSVVPSPFSAAVAHGLSGAASDSDGDGWIDAFDLYQHVHRHVDSLGRQRVTGFTLGTRGSMRLARHVASLTATEPATGVGGRTAQASGETADTTSADDGERRPAGTSSDAAGPTPRQRDDPRAPWDAQRWTRLFDYYRSCVARQSMLQQLPAVSGKEVAPCPMGSEVLLSGAADSWRASGRAAQLVASARENRQALRYGYPTILFDAARCRDGGRPDWKFAPLLVLDVEAVEKDGGHVLVPVDDPKLNSEALMSVADMGEDEVAELLAWFEADWGGSGVSGLGDKARSVCDRVGLARVHDLVPGDLRATFDLARPYRVGAQNVAMLHAVDGAAGAVKQLVGDLDVRGRSPLDPQRVDGTALAALTGRHAPVEPRPYYPVITGRSNAAQEEILQSAMTRPLTVATGAPGTGKSELITSVVTTCVAAGDSVLVASTNNDAVDVVVQRANELLPNADLVVRTGNVDRRAKEPDILTELRAARFDRVDVATAAERLADHERGSRRSHEALERIGRAEDRLTALAPARERERGRLPQRLARTDFGGATAVRQLAERVAKALDSRWTGWWHRWRLRRRLGVATADERTALLRFLGVEEQWREALGMLEAGPDPLDEHRSIAAMRERRREDSSTFLRGRVAQALAHGAEDIDARLQVLGSKASPWKGMQKLLRTVRAWGCTARSVRGVFPPTPGLFDLVVVDEASQCTIADLVPLLYRAKRALVIGDPHQLQPVNNLEYSEDRRYQAECGLDEDWLDDRSLTFTRYSAYHAAAAALSASGADILWLDEHYRCHPDIVSVVNRRFYGNRLAIRTDPHRLAAPTTPALDWIDVRGRTDRPGGFSCRNRQEAQRVIELLRDLWRELPEQVTIGVVAPFTAQVRQLRNLLGTAGRERIRVGTVHTFQGAECDVMVVSPTAAQGVHSGAGNWVVREQTLWNVAVTRARSRLYVVGDRRYWAEREGLLADLARVAHDEADRPPVPNAARTALFGALSERGVVPEVRTRVDGYECDLSFRVEANGRAIIIDGADDAASMVGFARRLHRAIDLADRFEAVSATRTARIPAWRCLAEPGTVADELLRA